MSRYFVFALVIACQLCLKVVAQEAPANLPPAPVEEPTSVSNTVTNLPPVASVINAEPQQNVAQLVLINADRVSLRAQPSVKGGFICSLAKGTKLIAVDKVSNETASAADIQDWVKVSYNASGNVWVKSSYLNSTVPGVAKALSNVNIRAGAGTDQPKLGQLQAGETVTITEIDKAKGWARIKRDVPIEAHGYIAAKYVTYQGAVSAAQKAETLQTRMPFPIKGAVVSSTQKASDQELQDAPDLTQPVKPGEGEQLAVLKKDRVNLRVYPSVTRPIICTMPKDTEFVALQRATNDSPIEGEEKDWFIVRYNVSNNVWVKSSYLSTNLLGDVSATENVNLRYGPGTENAKLGVLRKGTLVTVKETSGGWTRIEKPIGLEPKGFVAAKYVELKGALSPDKRAEVLGNPSTANTATAVATAEPLPKSLSTGVNAVKADPATSVVTSISPEPPIEEDPVEEVNVKEAPTLKVGQVKDVVIPPVEKTETPEVKPEPIGEPEDIDAEGDEVQDPNLPEISPIGLAPLDSSAYKRAPKVQMDVAAAYTDRVVRREGILRSCGLDTPSSFALYIGNLRVNFIDVAPDVEIVKEAYEGKDSLVTIPEKRAELKPYLGKKIIVVGPEVLEERWKNTPTLYVHSIELAEGNE